MAIGSLNLDIFIKYFVTSFQTFLCSTAHLCHLLNLSFAIFRFFKFIHIFLISNLEFSRVLYLKPLMATSFILFNLTYYLHIVGYFLLFGILGVRFNRSLFWPKPFFSVFLNGELGTLFLSYTILGFPF